MTKTEMLKSRNLCELLFFLPIIPSSERHTLSLTIFSSDEQSNSTVAEIAHKQIKIFLSEHPAQQILSSAMLNILEGIIEI